MATMDMEQVKAAKERAAAVVNGFKCVTDQNARDALNLAEALEVKDRQIDAMRKRLLAAENPINDFLRGLGL